MRIIYILNSLLTLIFVNKSENSIKEPVRLNKVTEEKPNRVKNKFKNLKKIPINKILIIIGLITILVLITVIIYHTGGSLESTNYYYRLLK